MSSPYTHMLTPGIMSSEQDMQMAAKIAVSSSKVKPFPIDENFSSRTQRSPTLVWDERRASRASAQEGDIASLTKAVQMVSLADERSIVQNSPLREAAQATRLWTSCPKSRLIPWSFMRFLITRPRPS